MTILTVGDGGEVLLPAHIPSHLGVTGETILKVRKLPGGCLEIMLPAGDGPIEGTDDPAGPDVQASSLDDRESRE